MKDQHILIAGLPGSGKTTFLAALWHLVTMGELPTELSLDTLEGCEATHLNALANLWRDATVPDRTRSGTLTQVLLRLKSETSGRVSMRFADLSGEDYRDLWERRAYLNAFGQFLTSSSRVLLFINADRLVIPRWVIDEAALRQALGIEPGQKIPREWSPKLAPTQVQIVDLFQILMRPPFQIGPRRLCIVLSAWDKAEGDGRSPADYLSTYMPLVHQFLESNPEHWTWTVVGISAQGGDYGAKDEEDKPRAELEAKRMHAIEVPSTRIKVVGLGEETHDLTRLITWLSA